MTHESLSNITNRFLNIKERVHKACLNAGRDIDNVLIIGASKKKPASLISQFSQQGLTDIGENYLQEAVEKREQLLEHALNWHFIGQIQSNKTKTIAENFDWVHSVDRLKIARRLGQQNPQADKPINLLVQLNPDHEGSKGGLELNKASELCIQIAEIEGVTIRGFMMIPKARETYDEQCRVFSMAKEQLDLTNQRYGLTLDTLSMGMSGDLEAAIASGSTMIRIGTDLFGAR